MANHATPPRAPGLVTRGGRRAPLIATTPRQQAAHAQAMAEAQRAFDAHVAALPTSRGGKKVCVQITPAARLTTDTHTGQRSARRSA